MNIKPIYHKDLNFRSYKWEWLWSYAKKKIFHEWFFTEKVYLHFCKYDSKENPLLKMLFDFIKYQLKVNNVFRKYGKKWIIEEYLSFIAKQDPIYPYVYYFGIFKRNIDIAQKSFYKNFIIFCKRELYIIS